MRSAANVVVIAASAGGHDGLRQILGGLPADFPAAVLIVQHLSPVRESVLAQMLARSARLPVTQVRGAEYVRRGHVYVAPPDRHLIVRRRGILSLSRRAKMHFTRPAADLLFTSAASEWRDATIGVVLSGYGRDGSTGTRFIKELSGTCIAQDPASAQAPHMPQAAIATGAVDVVLPPSAIAHALITFAMVPGAAGWFSSPANLRAAS